MTAGASWFQFHRKRRSLERLRVKISRLHDEALRKLQKATHDDKQRLHAEYRGEQEIYEDELAVLTSRYLMSIARRIFLPIPEFKTEGGAWDQASTSGLYHLSSQALSDLRSAIRKEQKERHEIWLLWVAALKGLVGALTGLVAVWGN